MTMAGAIRNPAQKCLDELIAEAEEKQTMAAWRLGDERIRKLLEDFAAKDDWAEYSEEVQYEVQTTLFLPLNSLMWEQEVLIEPELLKSVEKSEDFVDSLPIIFGGKFAPEPWSISERMVELLSTNGESVITVSRSEVTNTPSGVTHISKRCLDQPGGEAEFRSVIEEGLKHEKPRTVFYFTLGQHKGVDPFNRNVVAAQNFATALTELTAKIGTQFKVVITGTDATLPSDHDDSTLEVDDKTYDIPKYKIMIYNFVYAMSKLCQFYIIADAINVMLETRDSKLVDDIAKMKAGVQAAGENGTYDEANGVSLQELDRISAMWPSIVKSLSTHLKVAAGISICYTPLHRQPWTQASFVKSDAESHGSPRGYILQQVIRRMKNAISVDKAARTHFS